MAKFDRCEICDYQTVEGSMYADVAPYENGGVRRTVGGQLLCKACRHEIMLSLPSMDHCDPNIVDIEWDDDDDDTL